MLLDDFNYMNTSQPKWNHNYILTLFQFYLKKYDRKSLKESIQTLSIQIGIVAKISAPFLIVFFYN